MTVPPAGSKIIFGTQQTFVPDSQNFSPGCWESLSGKSAPALRLKKLFLGQKRARSAQKNKMTYRAKFNFARLSLAGASVAVGLFSAMFQLHCTLFKLYCLVGKGNLNGFYWLCAPNGLIFSVLIVL